MATIGAQKIGSDFDLFSTDDQSASPVSRKKPKLDKGGSGKKPKRAGTPKADVIVADASNNTLSGLNGNDRLEGAAGDDLLDGGNGKDILVGGDGNDRLLGGNGKDMLVGGNGSDTLTGGNGKDVFVFTSLQEGLDTITDLSKQDVIDLRGIFAVLEVGGSDPLTRFQQFVQLVQVGANTEVQIDADGSGLGTTFTPMAVLQNVTATSLSAVNFVIR